MVLFKTDMLDSYLSIHTYIINCSKPVIVLIIHLHAPVWHYAQSIETLGSVSILSSANVNIVKQLFNQVSGQIGMCLWYVGMGKARPYQCIASGKFTDCVSLQN